MGKKPPTTAKVLCHYHDLSTINGMTFSTSSLLHTGSQRCLITIIFMEHHITSRNVKVSLTTFLLCCCCPIPRERKVEKSCGIEVVWQWPLWPSTPAVMWQWKNNTRHSTKVAAFTFDRKVFWQKENNQMKTSFYSVYFSFQYFFIGLIWCGAVLSPRQCPLPVLYILKS